MCDKTALLHSRLSHYWYDVEKRIAHPSTIKKKKKKKKKKKDEDWDDDEIPPEYSSEQVAQVDFTNLPKQNARMLEGVMIRRLPGEQRGLLVYKMYWAIRQAYFRKVKKHLEELEQFVNENKQEIDMEQMRLHLRGAKMKFDIYSFENNGQTAPKYPKFKAPNMENTEVFVRFAHVQLVGFKHT